jgi:predicted CXXCH cytochrome family protein
MKNLVSRRWTGVLGAAPAAALLGVGLLFSGTASAQSATIVGSPHDFSAQAWNAAGEICVVCHAPHNTITEAEAGVTGELGPLWNRTLTGVTNYSLYTSLTRVGSFIDSTGFGQPTGVSKLCLSCHDGTIAIDSYGRNADNSVNTGGTTFVYDINANANIGEGSGTTGDLSNDHPVAFTFPTPTQDPEITAAAGGFVAGVLPLFGTGTDQMECATCHDVHATGTFAKLLRVDNSGSGLCLTCHVK